MTEAPKAYGDFPASVPIVTAKKQRRRGIISLPKTDESPNAGGKTTPATTTVVTKSANKSRQVTESSREV